MFEIGLVAAGTEEEGTTEEDELDITTDPIPHPPQLDEPQEPQP